MHKKYFSIDEAFSDLKIKLNNAIESNENKITVIKAQTAIGKTHCYVNLVKNSDKLFVIAVPTNILKDEVYESLISEDVNGAVKTRRRSLKLPPLNKFFITFFTTTINKEPIYEKFSFGF